MLTGWLNIEIQEIDIEATDTDLGVYSAVLDVSIELDEPPKEIKKKEKRRPKRKALQCFILESFQRGKVYQGGG